MKALLTALSLLCLACASAQDSVPNYADLVRKAEALYDAKDFRNSGLAYSQAFALRRNIPEYDRYNAACSWSLAKVADSAFAQLDKIGQRYQNFEHASTDGDLDNLHADKRWQEWLDQVKENRARALAKLDRPLMAQLAQVFKDDQNLRKQLPELQQQYGPKSEEVQKHWQRIEQMDKANLALVTKLLDEKGFPSQDAVGGQGVSAIFLVIQHADQATREKYMPMLAEATAKGDLPSSSFALLKDRTDLGQGKKQTYGSQIATDPDTGKSYVRPLEDPQNVDKRRASVGLEPLADYVRGWNIEWDATRYLRDYPQIEATEKKLFVKK